MSEPAPYIGRFAPSPTGPLHFGSLLAAVASYLDARQRQGRWLVRIDDIDPPREQPGASEAIIRALEAYGFEWDGEIIYQSRSEDEQRAAVEKLFEAGLGYPCGCSRRMLADFRRGPLGSIYPGTCRKGTDATETAIRVRTNDDSLTFRDALQGVQSQRLESESGDFVIRRRDGLIAYQLAVVVDDELHGITHIVRGIDLMGSTPRQIWLQRLLGYRTPDYAHIPVAINRDGDKLSKLTGAKGLPMDETVPTLIAALKSLGQQPPERLRADSLADVWHWAHQHWRLDVMRGQSAISAEAIALVDAENPLR